MILFFLTVFSWNRPAWAEANPVMADYFSTRLSSVIGALSTCSSAPAQEGLQLSDVNLDLTPSVSLGVSSVLNLTVSPEVDFVFAAPVGP